MCRENETELTTFVWCEKIDLVLYQKQRLKAYEKNKVKTNADRIRAMSDDEMAEQLVVAVNGLQPCTLYYSIPTERTFLIESEAVKVTLDWLQHPAEEGT